MPTKLKARPASAAVAGKNGHSLISNEKFRHLYAALVKYELLEERLGLSHADAAGAVGLTLDLERDDTVVLNTKAFAANFIKGVPARALTPATPSAIAQAGLATGAALANKMAKNRKVAVAFIQGGTAALSECREALELASVNNLPVIYVIRANPDRKLAKVLAEAGAIVPIITVDAYDVVAVYRVAQESIARARDGGPSLVVCVPHRLNGTAENALLNMERYLTGKKIFRNRWKDQAIAEINREVGAACLPPANLLA